MFRLVKCYSLTMSDETDNLEYVRYTHSKIAQTNDILTQMLVVLEYDLIYDNESLVNHNYKQDMHKLDVN